MTIIQDWYPFRSTGKTVAEKILDDTPPAEEESWPWWEVTENGTVVETSGLSPNAFKARDKEEAELILWVLK